MRPTTYRELKRIELPVVTVTHPFSTTLVKRNRRNRITHLQNPDGSHSTTPEQLANTLIHCFQSIFASQNQPPHQPTASQQPSPSTLLPARTTATTNHDHNPAPEEIADTTTVAWDCTAQDTYANSIPDMQELYDIVR